MSKHTFLTIPIELVATPYFLLAQIIDLSGLYNPKYQDSLGAKTCPLHNDPGPAKKPFVGSLQLT